MKKKANKVAKPPTMRHFLLRGLEGGALLGGLTGLALLVLSWGGFPSVGLTAIALISGAVIGTAIGGLTGGLIGLKKAEPEAPLYEGGIRHCNILISLQANDAEQIRRAQRIFGDTDCPVSSPLRSGRKSGPRHASR